MSAWRIDADDLPAIAPAWDDAVDRTPGVDAFCASTPWSFSAATSFPAAQPPVVVGDGHAFCGLRTTTTELGPALVGLDPVWGFATPLVGTPMRAAEMLFHRLSLDDWALAVIAGQREDSELTAALARVADGRWTLFRGTEEHRLRADLRGGFDRWFARRSSRFRQQARRIERVAGERGVEILDLSAGAPDHVFDRLLAIETHAWKGRAGTGLASEELADFYRQVCGRLAATDHLRVLVARLDGAGWLSLPRTLESWSALVDPVNEGGV